MLTADGLVVVPGTYGAIFAFQQTSQGLVTNWNQSGAGLRLWLAGDSSPPLADGSGKIVWGKAVLRAEDQAVLSNEGVGDDSSLIPEHVALSSGIRYGAFRSSGGWTVQAQTFPDLEPAGWGPISVPGQGDVAIAVTPSGLVVVATVEGTFAHEVADATLRWSSPPFGTKGIAVGPSGTIYVSDGYTLRALDSANGNVMARYISTLQDGALDAPTVDADERLYLSTSAGPLSLVRNGTELVEAWHFDVTQGAIRSRPSIDTDGTLYYSLDTSEILALTP